MESVVCLHGGSDRSCRLTENGALHISDLTHSVYICGRFANNMCCDDSCSMKDSVVMTEAAMPKYYDVNGQPVYEERDDIGNCFIYSWFRS